MEFNEFLQTIMYLVATVLMPVVVKYVADYLSAKKTVVTEQLENQKIRKYADDAFDCVMNAVIEVNQTFVDSLKKSGTFSPEAQEQAFTMAKNKIISVISEESINAINLLYSDFNSWLNTQIEVCVNTQKD